MRVFPAAAVLAFWPVWALAQMPSASQISPGAAAATPEITAFQDWQTVCADAACRSEPRITAIPDLSLSVVWDDADAVLILYAPLGLLLGEGVAVNVDGRSLGRLAFLTCEADGCVAPVRLDGTLNTALRRGTALTLTLFRRDGSEIGGIYSLLGFTAAMNSLEARARDGLVTP